MRKCSSYYFDNNFRHWSLGPSFHISGFTLFLCFISLSLHFDCLSDKTRLFLTKCLTEKIIHFHSFKFLQNQNACYLQPKFKSQKYTVWLNFLSNNTAQWGSAYLTGWNGGLTEMKDSLLHFSCSVECSLFLKKAFTPERFGQPCMLCLCSSTWPHFPI